MNKFKVGQTVKIKVTGKEGKILEIDDVDIDKDGRSFSCYNVFFPDGANNFFTVHDLEEVKNILDSEEKEYLSNVIKPFRDSAINIKKFENYRDRQKEYIKIYIKNDFSINLPNFKKNTMYKNMEINKAYTLEELGL